MPARIVLVHDDSDFLDPAAAALGAAGYDVAAFAGSLSALSALEDARTVELLITRVRFSPGSPHGVSLARMARRKIPNLKVLFIAQPEHQKHTEGVGEFMPAPAGLPELLRRVSEMLAERPPGD